MNRLGALLLALVAIPALAADWPNEPAGFVDWPPAEKLSRIITQTDYYDAATEADSDLQCENATLLSELESMEQQIAAYLGPAAAAAWVQPYHGDLSAAMTPPANQGETAMDAGVSKVSEGDAAAEGSRSVKFAAANAKFAEAKVVFVGASLNVATIAATVQNDFDALMEQLEE